MPDIDPAALSRPSVSLSTPTLKSITVSAPSTQKVTKTSQIIPARIDLEPLYTALKSAIGNEQWNTYKESTTQFILGKSLLALPCLHKSYPYYRTLESDRVFRTYRSYTIQWRQNSSPQPASCCYIRKPHEGNARPRSCALGFCE